MDNNYDVPDFWKKICNKNVIPYHLCLKSQFDLIIYKNDKQQ